MIPFDPPLLPAAFVRRENRFRARVVLDGAELPAHVPNSGRLGELLTPGARCWVSPAAHPGKTACTLRLVEHRGQPVSVDARLPPALFEDAWRRCALADPFAACTDLRREVRLGESRLDIRLACPDSVIWVETKSVTLVVDGVALFPDAPTLRGRKHVLELAAARRRGDGAAVVFVVQRADAVAWAPHPMADPALAAALAAAHQGGVVLLAYRCAVTLAGIELAEPIPVRLAYSGASRPIHSSSGSSSSEARRMDRSP